MSGQILIYGSFSLNKPLDDETYQILQDISEKTHNIEKMPSKYCPWSSDENRKEIISELDSELVDQFEEWMVYLCINILSPKGFELKGSVEVVYDYLGDGENTDTLIMTIKNGKIYYE